MSTVDDLLIQHRRGELSEADERRLQIAVQTSPELSLSLLAAAEFERAGAPQAGDTALVRKIVRRVEGEWSGTFPRVAARRRLSRWVAAPLLAASAAAASFGGYRALQDLRTPPAASPALSPTTPTPPATPAAAPLPAAAAAAPLPAAAAAAPLPAAAAAPPPSAAAAPFPAAAAAPPPAPKPHAPKPRIASNLTPAPPPPAAVPAAAVPAAALPAAPPDLDESPRTLFRRANRLRQSDWESAASLYEQLTLRFADSHEAGVAEMALAKHALAEGRASEALRWFHAYQQRPGGELAPEALWGEARAFESLGERPHAQALWRRLIEQYPASAYAAAAREQLGP